MPTVGQYGAFPVTDNLGHPLAAGTLIRVFLPDGVTLATVYTDITGTVTAANPVALDALSNLTFYALSGQYKMAAVVSGVQQPTEPCAVPVVPATVRPIVTGSRGGNVALASLLTALVNLGLITDSSTP